MNDEIVRKEDLFNVIKHGHKWYEEIIKEGLQKIIDKNYSSFNDNHSIRWDSDDNYHFIYDNECYLFIFERRIELRCDRENVFSSHQAINFPITTVNDIELAYEKFKSMTMEGEDDD